MIIYGWGQREGNASTEGGELWFEEYKELIRNRMVTIPQ